MGGEEGGGNYRNMGENLKERKEENVESLM